jgi:hypothetical protein
MERHSLTEKPLLPTKQRLSRTIEPLFPNIERPSHDIGRR